MHSVSRYGLHVTAKWVPQRRRLARLGVGVGAAWVVANVATGYAAANLWLTELVWRTPHRTGQLAAAIPGTPIRAANVAGHHVPPGHHGSTVIVVHGYNGSRDSPPIIDVTRWLRETGYGVLAIDLGYRDGRHRYSAGHREAHDIRAAISWLTSQGEPLAGVWAFSAGAHAALVAAATGARIPWVIADGGFANAEAQARRTASASLKVLPPSALLLMAPMVHLFSGHRPVDLLAIPWSGVPVLIVHGEADQVVPIGNAHAIRDHTGGELLLLPKVGHTEAHRSATAAYRAASMSFIQRVSSGEERDATSRPVPAC